jgi:hypothetical protein
MKSVKLSLVCTRLVEVLVLACVLLVTVNWRKLYLLPVFSDIAASWTPGGGGYDAAFVTASSGVWLLPLVCLACCVPALLALVSLDRLLGSIGRGEVFIAKNVRALRLISWCCFAEALLLAAAAWMFSLILFSLSIAAAFFGLILRVVKNVIEAAVLIKAENDLTI